MRSTASRIATGAFAAIALVVVLRAGFGSGLPDRLTDEEFWALSQDSSEPGGYFRSADITNFTSNELLFQHVIPELVSRVKPGSVYLGVGPEQNYTYMVATRPRMAVIFDIRRGNLAMQLMYKAIFELSADRADFVSLLFSRPRPGGLARTSSVSQIFAAFDRVGTNAMIVQKNLASIKDHLTRTRRLPLSERDLESISIIYRTFSGGFHLREQPSYWSLMVETDTENVQRSYLATEEGFAWLKDLQSRNLVVPVVGDFSGPKAIRAIGQYLKSKGGTVGAFYLSNVEQYLLDGKWEAFCRNVTTLPFDASSTFIRSQSGGGGARFGRGGGFVNSLGSIEAETRVCR